MLFSREWLAEYVELPEDPQELADALTSVGLAVDGFETLGGDDSNNGDVVFDVDVTTNRPDCMNHFGLARELAVIYGKPLKPPKVEIRATRESVTETASLVIEDFDHCPRYDAMVIRDVQVGPSPDWLVRRLEAIGSRSINNVVDITNYVMWETGQPLHAYDLDRLGNEVRVRFARPGEELVTLDGETRELDPEILVIADAERAVGLAGVMGGLDTEVIAETRHILLEGAHFNPKVVQKASKRLGLHTDASHRFERGADPEGCLRGVQRGAALIVELAGGEILSGELEDQRLRGDWPPVVDLELAKLNRFGGVEIESGEVEATLTGLGFGIEPLTDASWRVTVPSWRYYDFENPYVADLYEEVLRIHGFDNILSTLPRVGGADAPARPEHLRSRKVRDHLAASGFAEAITFAFTNRTADQTFPSLCGDGEALALANPLSDRYAVMRRSVLSNLVASARYNQRRGAPVVRLFEIGHVFADDGSGGKVEVETVAVVAGGQLGTPWERPTEIDFFDLKGALESLLSVLGAELEARPATVRGLAAGAAAEIRIAGGDGRLLGYLGQLADDEGPYPLFVAELDLEQISGEPDLTTHSPSKYPAIAVDSTLTHALDVPWADVARTIEESGTEDLREFGLKDRYHGEGVPDGAVNSTLYFLYNSDDRSLVQEEINERHQRLAAQLEKRFGLASDARP